METREFDGQMILLSPHMGMEEHFALHLDRKENRNLLGMVYREKGRWRVSYFNPHSLSPLCQVVKRKFFSEREEAILFLLEKRRKQDREEGVGGYWRENSNS